MFVAQIETKGQAGIQEGAKREREREREKEKERERKQNRVMVRDEVG